MANNIIEYLFLSLCIPFVIGCSALGSGVTPNGLYFLEIAIVSIDVHGSSCTATDFSTEDQRVLDLLRGRKFQISSYKESWIDGGVEYGFIIKPAGQAVTLSADVFVEDGECSSYTFSRISN